MNTQADPWTLERAKHMPGQHLLRLIDLESDTQRWIALKVMAEGIDFELDGTVLIFPARKDGRTPEEITRIIELYDHLYREQMKAAA